MTIGAGLYAPGHVTRTSASNRPSFAVGELNGMLTPRIQELVTVLTPAGPDVSRGGTRRGPGGAADTIRGGRSATRGRPPSLLQDVLKGRRTEVDYLNGYVVRRGRAIGVPTPMNEAIVALTKRLEAGELKPSPANLQLLPTRS